MAGIRLGWFCCRAAPPRLLGLGTLAARAEFADCAPEVRGIGDAHEPGA